VRQGVRIYAFGDVHGRADLLRGVFAAIEKDRGEAIGLRHVIVGLGDYVDRGGAVHDVLQMLIHGVDGCELVALRGNHEQMLLDFLEDPQRHGTAWIANGALDTLRAYGVDIGGIGRPNDAELRSIRDAFARSIPPSHLLFLEHLALSYTSGDYFFAHAGVRPTKSVEQQVARDLLWIRQGFADRDEPTDKFVVHGHTPVEQPYFGRYRVNLDTGAYFTNRLSCLVLENTAVRLLEV
jgi:serine/threonine protein phosphatase 1